MRNTATRALLIGLGLAAAACATGPQRPNVVVVLVDDMRSDDVGYAGHPFVKTPNIDRIAREGARFDNAFATTPLCSPSRASFFTGQYAHRHGITDNTNRSVPSHQLATFPRVLEAAGYRTAFVGKWHMGNDDSPRPGFTHWVALRGQGTMFDPPINENGREVHSRGYVTDVLTDHAVRFVEGAAASNKPFLLYLAHKALHPELVQRDDGSLVAGPHGGFVPPPRHADLYANERVPRRPNALEPPHGKPALERKIGDLPPLGPGTGTRDHDILTRLRMLTVVDEGLGQLRAALERTGQLDRTFLVVTSDHGYFYGEHGLDQERRLAYEETIRIPLCVRYPPLIAPGHVITDFVLNLDLAPTLIDIAGARDTEERDGRSLLPLLRGQRADWRTSFLVEYFTDTVFPRVANMGYRAVRTDRYKLIRYSELDGMDELYDLRADPFEMNNLIGRPEAAGVTRELAAEIDRLCAGRCRGPR